MNDETEEEETAPETYICSACGGHGYVDAGTGREYACTRCGGDGEVTE